MGAQLLLISFATRLHGICNGSNNRIEDGGGEHTCHSLGTGDKCTHPKFPSLVWDWEGKQQCFSLPDQTTGDFKIPLFASPGHTRSPVCAHPNPNVHIFFSSNQGVFFSVFIVLTAFVSLSPPPPPPPPPWVWHCI